MDDFINDLQTAFAKNFKGAVPQVREILRASIDRNFAEGGRFGNDNVFGGGSNKWPISRRAQREGSITLTDKRILANSIRISVSYDQSEGFSIVMGSSAPYARIHQFGGTIDFPARSSLFAQKRNASGRFKKGRKNRTAARTLIPAHSVTIPPRPYLVIQNEDLLAIAKAIAGTSEHV